MEILDDFSGKNKAEKGQKYFLDIFELRPTSTMMDEEQYWDIIDYSLSNSKALPPAPTGTKPTNNIRTTEHHAYNDFIIGGAK